MKTRFLYLPLFLFSTFFIYLLPVSLDYGMRDDYSIIRETHEEPGTVLRFVGSQGRPLYGVLLELSYRHIHSVDDLVWLRLISAFFVSIFSFMLFRQLQRFGWPTWEAVSVALLVIYLPAVQITISWAVGWAWSIPPILAILGFGSAEQALAHKTLSRTWHIIFALVLYVLATAIYQPGTLFAVVVLAALLLSPTVIMSRAETIRRCVFHLVIVFSALILTYALMKILFYSDVFYPSSRLQFETDIISKPFWFISQAIPNALTFLVLRDDFDTGVVFFWSIFSLFTALLAGALYKQYRNNNHFNWLLCVFVLPWVAHCICLVAAERSLSYRTTYALAGLALVLLVAAMRELLPARLRYVTLSLTVLAAAIMAYQQTRYLIAEPQAREWRMMVAAVNTMQPGIDTRIYLIEPKPADRSTLRVYRDEFGSFSSNSSWAPDEMFKVAMFQRFPDGITQNWHYEFTHGGEEPASNEHYDQIIDMRTLKNYRP